LLLHLPPYVIKRVIKFILLIINRKGEHMKPRNLLLLALLLLIHQTAFAGVNGTLSGVVKDVDGKPLPGAAVRVMGTSKGTATKKDGSYRILNIPSGTYSVTYSSLSYKTQTIKNVIISADQTTEKNVTLQLEVSKTGEVKVIADKIKMVDERVVGVTKNLGADVLTGTTRESAVALATTQAGVQQSGGQLVIRGSRTTDTQIKIDGQDISDPISGGLGAAASLAGSLDYAPTASAFATSETQVMTGNFSAQYGNAMGGVVNQVAKQGRTDKYEGLLRWKTDVPGLFGKSGVIGRPGDGLQALAAIENTFDANFGGPIPFLDKSTFFISGRYFTEQHRNNGLDVRDRGGNSLGQFPNNTSAVRNITGRIALQLSDDIKLILGGSWGLTALQGTSNLDRNSWVWLYANTPAQYMRPNADGGLDTFMLSSVPEQRAKQTVLNNFIYSYFARINHNLSENSFYEATLSLNDNIVEDGRLNMPWYSNDISDPNRIYGSRVINGVVQDPSALQNTVPGDRFFTGYDIWKPQDLYVSTSTNFGPGNAYSFGSLRRYNPATLQDRVPVLDIYDQMIGTYQGRPISYTNPITGYVEGGEDKTSSSNPYGLSGIDYFNARGNADGLEFRRSNFVQFDGNYQHIVDAGTTKHLIKAGIDARFYSLSRYNNGSNPWATNPFYDVYSSEYGGNIYTKNDIERANSSKAINASIISVYAEDQISYKSGITINPSVRLDIFNPQTSFRIDPTILPGTAGSESEQATVKIQANPRIFVSYPVTDRSFFSVGYGWYSQTPRFSLVYDNTTSQINRGNAIVGNPDLRPEITKQYNIGYNIQLSDDFAFDVQGYFKDVYGLTGLVYVQNTRNPYSLYSNGEYGNSRGVEFTLRKRLSNNFGFNVNYALATNVATSSASGSNYGVILAGADPFSGRVQFPLTEFPIDNDRRHRFNYIVDFVWGKDEGPSIGGVKFLQNTAINFTGLYQTGLPFTLRDIRGNQIGDFNAQRQPDIWTVDMRLQRSIPLADIFGDGMGTSELILFADVINLVNRTEAVSLNERTNDPINDGNLLYKQLGEFIGPLYSKADPFNSATTATAQFDNVGVRRYNSIADTNRDGVLTQREQLDMHFQFTNDAFSRRGRFQFPRQVFFGFMIRF
jgi:outer membrane receptor protein involved in Fe transport